MDDSSSIFEQLEKLKNENRILKSQVDDLKILYTNLAEHNTLVENELEEKFKIIEAANKKIKDSVIYAKRIQNAILPNIDYLKNIFEENFVLHRSKDIVSGDFYWFKKFDNKVFIAAVDCTGHGVPGAFMSMLGVAFLNEIILKNENITPSEILENLRSLVKVSLKQNINSIIAKDGMDISLCTIDFEKDELQFAGANNPLYLIRKDELIIFRGTRSPIGVYLMERPFENNVISLQNGDLIYLFTDGYYDQMDINNKKFKINNFRSLLLSIKNETLENQKALLEKNYDNFRSYQEQLDDILVIGLKYQ